MSPSLPPHSTRAALVAAYRTARQHAAPNELVLDAAARAGQLLAEIGDAHRALTFEREPDSFGLVVRGFVRVVILEERELGDHELTQRLSMREAIR